MRPSGDATTFERLLSSVAAAHHAVIDELLAENEALKAQVEAGEADPLTPTLPHYSSRCKLGPVASSPRVEVANGEPMSPILSDILPSINSHEARQSEIDTLVRLVSPVSFDEVVLPEEVTGRTLREAHQRRSERGDGEDEGPCQRATSSAEVVEGHVATDAEPPLPTPPKRRAAIRAPDLTEVSGIVGFELWPVWTQDSHLKMRLHEDAGSGSVHFRSPLSPGQASQRSSLSMVKAGDALPGSGLVSKITVRPSCPQRIFWDFLSLIFMAYDVIMIPMQAFPMRESEGQIGIGHASTVFWSMDIIGSFFVGFNDMGVLDMRNSSIAARYLRSWFILDFVIVAVDWFLVFVTDSQAEMVGMLRIGKSLRMARVLRVFRLLRIAKVMSYVEELSDLIGSESLLTSFNIAKLLIAIAIVNHFIASGWFGMATLQEGHATTWKGILDVKDADSISTGYYYATSLHWSLTQFTPASMEVTPENTYERIYCICVIIFALVSFSSFISSITSAMTHLRQLNEEKTKQRENVRRYITDNQVSMELGNRISGFLRQHRQMQHKRVHENDIPGFRSMPESLRVQLHCEIYLPVLMPHPFFFSFNESDDSGAGSVCHTAMSEKTITQNSEVFSCGSTASSMVFVLSGRLLYCFGSVGEDPDEVLVAGGVACEMPLWVPWDHRGRLLSSNVSELILLEASAFRSAVKKADTFMSCRAYAKRYVFDLQKASITPQGVTDLWFDFDEVQDAAQRSFADNAAVIEGGSEGRHVMKKSHAKWYGESPRSWAASWLCGACAAVRRK